MSHFEEPGRQVAHVLLDVASSYDEAAIGTGLNEAAANLAVQRVAEIDGAYTVTIDDEGDETTVGLDLTHVLGGSIITVMRLVELLAEDRGVDKSEVINEVRQFLDS